VWYASSRTKPNDDWRITGRNEFEEIMGGDGMQVMVDTRDNNTLYTGYQFGNYSRVKLREEDYMDLSVRHTLGERPLRWNWQTPILLSKFNQDILYICSNKVHRSTDKGETFTTLSGDLTQGECNGNVPFGTLTTIDESKLQFGLLAVGSDDGRVHVSPDNGYTWKDVSASLPANMWVTRVQFSSHVKSRVYVTMNGYRNDHFNAYMFVSENLGKTWQSISGDLPLECVNVLLEDSKNEDLLYAGTDHGLYVSTNRGVSWSIVSGDLPAVAIHDLVVQEREEDLVVGTHGRSIWIIDLEPLREFMKEQKESVVLFSMPVVNWRSDWGGNWSKWLEPQIPEQAISIYASSAATCTVEIVGPDSMKIATLGELNLNAGYNRIPYDLSIAEDRVKSLQDSLNKGREAADMIRIRKADNGKYYLPKGNYKVLVSGAFGTKQTSCRLE
jgi:hypothetical protein